MEAFILGIAFLAAWSIEKMFEISLGCIEEIARHAIVVGFTVGNLSDPIPVKAKEDGARVA